VIQCTYGKLHFSLSHLLYCY